MTFSGAEFGGVASPPVEADACSIACGAAAFAELSADVLRASKGLRFRARGVSMSPLVRDGDVVWVRPAKPASLRVGDVVLCASGPGRVVVHRVVGRRTGPDGPQFLVQGDQVPRPDGWIPAAQVYGRVAAVERPGALIDMDQPAVRWLGRLAAVRSRWALGRGRCCRLPRWLFGRLPGVSRYLA